MGPLPTARLPDLGDPGPLGFPEEDGWTRAEGLAPLVRAQDGRAVLAVTAVRVGSTARALCLRFDCAGGVPACTHVARGAPLWEESVVEAFLAAGEETPARYLEIEVNPAAALFDALVENPDGDRRRMRLRRRGLAEVVARVGRPAPGRWSVEILVPWTEIPGARAPCSSFRANFYRIDRPADGPPEYAAWSPTFADPPDFHAPHRFGRLLRGGA